MKNTLTTLYSRIFSFHGLQSPLFNNTKTKTMKTVMAAIVITIATTLFSCTKKDVTQPIETTNVDGFRVIVPTTANLFSLNKGDVASLDISYNYSNVTPQSIKVVLLAAPEDNKTGGALSTYTRVDSVTFTNLNTAGVPGITSTQLTNLPGYYNANVKLATLNLVNKRYHTLLWYARTSTGSEDYKVSPDVIYIK